MRTSRVLLAAAFAAAAAAVPASARAQGIPRLSVEGAGLYVSPSGTDFSGIDGAFGFEAQARLALGGMLSVGAGFQRSVHDLQGFSDNMRVNGFFAEPRLAISVPGPIRPYILGRATRTIERVDVDNGSGGTDKLETRGWGFAAGAGVMLHFAPTAALNLSAEYGHVSLGDMEQNGSTVSGTKSSGQDLSLRVGVSVGFGH